MRTTRPSRPWRTWAQIDADMREADARSSDLDQEQTMITATANNTAARRPLARWQQITMWTFVALLATFMLYMAIGALGAFGPRDPAPVVRQWVYTDAVQTEGGWRIRAVGALHDDLGLSGPEAAAAVRELTGQSVLRAVDGRVVAIDVTASTRDGAEQGIQHWRAQIETMLRAWGAQ